MSSDLSDEQKIAHMLNQLGYGPRPGDVERVKHMGIKKYIEEQLHPERIDDSATEARIKGLESLQMTLAELHVKYPAPERVAAQLVLTRQNQPNDMMEQNKPNMLEQEKIHQQTMAFYREHDLRPPRWILWELQAQKIIRATYSDRQLLEVMNDFWMNHFNVFWSKGADRWMTTDFEMNVIRPHAMGKFKDLLMATAKSPAMLFYLDNYLSSSPDATPPGMRRFHIQGVDQASKRKPGINENYARELKELHTMGVDGGYTQQDVKEVARCFTGWTIDQPGKDSRFVFRPWMHDDGEKVVLGHKIPSGRGIGDGEEVIEILARHPSTAKFIATKLVRRFVSDTPPKSLVDRVVIVYMNTDGDIREMLRTIFTSPEFYSHQAYRAKVKSPFELVVSTIRALGGDTDGSPLVAEFIAKMGQPLYQYQAPTGFPDRADEWINAGALLERLNFAVALSFNRIPGTTVNLQKITQEVNGAKADTTLKRAIAVLLHNDVSSHTLSVLEQHLKKPLPVKGSQGDDSETPKGSLAGIDDYRSSNEASMQNQNTHKAPSPRQMILDGWARISKWQVPTPPPTDPNIAQVFALVIGSPEFQRR